MLREPLFHGMRSRSAIVVSPYLLSWLSIGAAQRAARATHALQNPDDQLVRHLLVLDVSVGAAKRIRRRRFGFKSRLPSAPRWQPEPFRTRAFRSAAPARVKRHTVPRAAQVSAAARRASAPRECRARAA